MIKSPSDSSDPFISTSLRRLLDETSDLIDSPPFTHVLTLLLDAGYSTLVDNKLASLAYKIPVDPISQHDAPLPQVTEIHDPKPVKLPIVLAILTKQAHNIGNGVPNEYLQAMENVRDLEAFAAVVYSSNWESDMIEEGNDGVAARVKDKGKEKEKEQVPGGEESVIDVTKSTFESAWGKATESVKST
jgi:peroxin-3